MFPDYLQEAIASLTQPYSSDKLQAASDELTRRYRGQSHNLMTSPLHRAAYIAVRMPATFAVVKRVLQELELRSNETYETLLDLGSGPGTALWAASEVFHFTSAVCLEQDAALIDIAKHIHKLSSVPNVAWQPGDLTTAAFPNADLIVMSYALNELSDPIPVVTKAWHSTNKALVLIEPGTMPGFANIRAARQHLIDIGASIAAPCPHRNACPMPPNDWCHFSERLQRTSQHRQIKGGTLGHEDEKYSYVIATKSPSDPCQARVLRHPQKHSGHLQVDLCTPEGLLKKTLSKRDGELYKQARKWEWGDGVQNY